jgi:hypothetical protein
MNNNKNVLLVSLGLIGLGLYYFYKQSKQVAEIAQGQSDESGVISIADWNKVLKKGSKGIEVKILQKSLKQLVVDGDFGAKTEARLKNVVGVTEVSLNKYNELLKNKK